MKEFVEKLIERLEKYKYSHLIERDSEMLEHCKEKEMDCEGSDCFLCVWDKATEIVNQLAEEYNNDFCQWKYNGIMYDICPHTETRFARIHNCDENIFKFCPYCGKKIKIAPYQPKGE